MATSYNKKNTKGEAPANNFAFAFGTLNYILMGVGLVLLAIGYILLCGGGSDDPNTFNPAMFDGRRLVAAPVMIILGFVVEIAAIMIKSGKKEAEETKSEE
ncbi:MAG: DUF3098 domain-containing protein [Bacteroidales bacterium]|nr:DUF3098 domain-containing protein [Bacteroidales bacterium]